MRQGAVCRQPTGYMMGAEGGHSQVQTSGSCISATYRLHDWSTVERNSQVQASGSCMSATYSLHDGCSERAQPSSGIRELYVANLQAT